MTVYFTPPFLDDIKNADDPKFVRRVLSHVCDGSGDFPIGRDDHRYDGIEGAWIRYVSAGKSAYRLIYVKRDADVYLYRAGPHSVEDNLSPPRTLEGVPVGKTFATSPPPFTGRSPTSLGQLVKTSSVVMLSALMRSMVHLQHREIVMVSPYYSVPMLDPKAPFGRFLDKAIEEDTVVSFVTRGGESTDLEFFESLEARGICVFFHPRLHAKMYLFDVDEDKLNVYTRGVKATAIIGSANLTDMGIALAGDGLGNEELCYRLPVDQFVEAKNHADWLIMQSSDFLKYRAKSIRKY